MMIEIFVKKKKNKKKNKKTPKTYVKEKNPQNITTFEHD